MMKYVLERDSTSLRRCLMVGWKLVGCKLACGGPYFATTNVEKSAIGCSQASYAPWQRNSSIKVVPKHRIDEGVLERYFSYAGQW